MATVGSVLAGLARDPQSALVRRWHWKAAMYSSLCRAGLFFAVNVSSGLRAATGAMLAELLYRMLTAGFYGSLTQAFRRVQPVWQGAAASVVLLVSVSHSLEFAIHWLRGTPNLRASIGASIAFTCVSTLFNLHAMRNGVFVIGEGSHSLGTDFKLLPGIVCGFLAQFPATIRQAITFLQRPNEL